MVTRKGRQKLQGGRCLKINIVFLHPGGKGEQKATEAKHTEKKRRKLLGGGKKSQYLPALN